MNVNVIIKTAAGALAITTSAVALLGLSHSSSSPVVLADNDLYDVGTVTVPTVAGQPLDTLGAATTTVPAVTQRLATSSPAPAAPVGSVVAVASRSAAPLDTQVSGQSDSTGRAGWLQLAPSRPVGRVYPLCGTSPLDLSGNLALACALETTDATWSQLRDTTTGTLARARTAASSAIGIAHGRATATLEVAQVTASTTGSQVSRLQRSVTASVTGLADTTLATTRTTTQSTIQTATGTTTATVGTATEVAADTTTQVEATQDCVTTTPVGDLSANRAASCTN